MFDGITKTCQSHFPSLFLQVNGIRQMILETVTRIVSELICAGIALQMNVEIHQVFWTSFLSIREVYLSEHSCQRAKNLLSLRLKTFSM